MQQGLELSSPPISTTSIQNTWKRRLKVLGIYFLFINIFGTLIKSPLTLYYLLYGGYPMLFVYLSFTIVYIIDKLLVKNSGFTPYEIIILVLLTYVMLQGGVRY